MSEPPNDTPLVGIIMGSLSDYKTLEAGLDRLKEWGVPHEVLVASAHRTPERVAAWASRAEARGIEVIIAAAGGAAHLPGVIAAHTVLPVIGLPIDSSSIRGVDALYAIVQMPPGIPVATVGINNSINAVVLALHILARIDPQWSDVLLEYRRGMAAKIDKQNRELRQMRPEAMGDAIPAAPAPELASIETIPRPPSPPPAASDQEEIDEVRPIDLTQPLEPDPGQRVIEREREDKPPARIKGSRRSQAGRRGRAYGRIPVDSDLLPIDVVERASACLSEGGVIALPTDTVYGLAVDAAQLDAVEQLFRLKGRHPNHPLAVFIDSQRMLASLVRNLSTEIRRMLEAFWPGPLTVIFERRAGKFDHLSPDATIGVRLPDHSVPLTLIQEYGRPLACTSANPTGQPPATTADEVEQYFDRNVNMILDTGPLAECPPSTIIDVTGIPFEILRQGAITREQLSTVVGEYLNPDQEE